MRIFNSDGSEVEACGNAARAVALLHGKPVTIETGGGPIALEADRWRRAEWTWALRDSEWEAIPLAYAMDTAAMPGGLDWA